MAIEKMIIHGSFVHQLCLKQYLKWLAISLICASSLWRSGQALADILQVKPKYELLILTKDMQQLALGYDADMAFSKLELESTRSFLFILSLDDVSSYNWVEQKITLSEDATQKLVELLHRENRFSRPLDKVKENMIS